MIYTLPYIKNQAKELKETHSLDSREYQIAHLVETEVTNLETLVKEMEKLT